MNQFSLLVSNKLVSPSVFLELLVPTIETWQKQLNKSARKEIDHLVLLNTICIFTKHLSDMAHHSLKAYCDLNKINRKELIKQLNELSLQLADHTIEGMNQSIEDRKKRQEFDAKHI